MIDEPNNTIQQPASDPAPLPPAPPEADEAQRVDAAEAEGLPAVTGPAPLAEPAAPVVPAEISAESMPAPGAEPAAVEPVAATPEEEEPTTDLAVRKKSPPKKSAKKAPRKVAKIADGAAVSAEPEGPAEPKSDKMDWYILKIQSNREESIREGLQRRVKIAGLDKFFGDVIVPTEMVTEFKAGKKRVVKRKLYPGYLVVHMEINEETWFLVRETPGIGDFTGASGRPSPMLPHEISRIVARQEEKSVEAPKLKINFRQGDRVKINDGTFENFEGEVDAIDQTNGRVTVMINIFGRSTPVELEYWQIEAV